MNHCYVMDYSYWNKLTENIVIKTWLSSTLLPTKQWLYRSLIKDLEEEGNMETSGEKEEEGG